MLLSLCLGGALHELIELFISVMPVWRHIDCHLFCKMGEGKRCQLIGNSVLGLELRHLLVNVVSRLGDSPVYVFLLKNVLMWGLLKCLLFLR